MRYFLMQVTKSVLFVHELFFRYSYGASEELNKFYFLQRKATIRKHYHSVVLNYFFGHENYEMSVNDSSNQRCKKRNWKILLIQQERL